MNKSKLFALIVFTATVSLCAFTYAQSGSEPVRLVVSNPTQPLSSIAPAGALRVPFTKVDLTARGADMTIQEIVVRRTGPADDRVFDEIVLLDSKGEEIGDGRLGLDHTVRFEEPILIPRDTTLHLTVAANMAEELEEFDGQVASLTITDISASRFIPVNF